MKLSEITHNENPDPASLLSQAEAKFNEACRAIESGESDKAYEILNRLSQDDLPPELADAVRIANDILTPTNSPDEKAEKIFQLLPGKFLHVYDDEHGWNNDAMRELAVIQRDLS